jgi:hypothetical protein
MNSRRKPWHRTKWGFIVAILFSPFWFVWKKSRHHRLLRIAVGGSIALIIFVSLVISLAHMDGSHSDATLNGSALNGNSATAATGGSNVVLHGYGALLADWNAAHTKDNRFTADTAYNPASDLGNGYSDKYAAVLFIGGRALAYQIGFSDNTSIDNARTAALQEFPSDATILWQQQNNSDSTNICYQMEVQSPTLGQVLQSDGDTFVEFQTIATSDTSTGVGYYADNVNNATIRNADYKTANAVGGC